MSMRTSPKALAETPAVEEESEFDAVEQQIEVVDVTDAADEATGLDDERVVPLDEDEYR